MTDGQVTIGRQRIELSNLDKVLFPDVGYTKQDLVDHYRAVAAVALPHYRDRPLSMHRFPDGIDDDGFFQKDVPDYFPRWIHRVTLAKENGKVSYVVADDEATLVYLANQACITPHLFLSRRDRPDHPDRLVFDLDPPGEDFEPVRQAARLVHDALEAVELPCFLQTTGSRGLHVVVPLDRSANFDAARKFAHDIATRLAARHADELTVAQRKSKRRGRVFLDYLRNAYGQTAVAPYAVRAIAGAPVATPLEWSELGDRRLRPQRYTIGNIRRRLGQKEDPWADISRHGHSIATAARRLERLREED
jgi:bifunctional non-homologous end joining protein LigD